MNISIYGIGWISKEEYGCIMKGKRFSYTDAKAINALSGKDIFPYPFKNFGRLDTLSKMTCRVVALALDDAGIGYSPGNKQDIGIIGTNTAGSLQSDIQYFKDYLESGRTLSRANLFIYTLPSSPLGEAAIYFGLQGPLLYATGPDRSLAAITAMAADMTFHDEVSAMLAGTAEEEEAVFFVVMKNQDAGRRVLCDVDSAIEILNKTGTVSGIIKELSNMKKGNTSL
jgi:3-oxoacyl-[acyl-carrier-protein] synthase II